MPMYYSLMGNTKNICPVESSSIFHEKTWLSLHLILPMKYQDSDLLNTFRELFTTSECSVQV